MPLLHQASTTLNRWSTSQLILRKKWHCLVHPLEHINLPILSNTAGRLVIDAQVAPTTAWQTEGETPSLCNTSLSIPRVKTSSGRPSSTQPTKTSMTRCFMMGHQWGMPSYMLRIVGSQGASIQCHVTRIRSLNWFVTCCHRNFENSWRINARGGKA